MESKPVFRWRWTIGGLLIASAVTFLGVQLWRELPRKPRSTTLTTVEAAEFPTSVDYATPIATLVKQGAYKKVSTQDILDFKTDALAQYQDDATAGKVVVTVTLVQFRDPTKSGLSISKAQVKKALDELGLRGANLREFLEFGWQYPEELSRRYSITTIGTLFRSHFNGEPAGLGHICMSGSVNGEMAFDDGSRSLFILWGSPDEDQKNLGNGWWFAAVPK